MNYYEHHLGDYVKATVHLTMLEDGAYRRLLDVYYSREAPLPADQASVCKLARATTSAERRAVALVLAEFFELRDDGYHQSRCDAEIAAFRDKASKARASAQARWGRERPQAERTADAMRTHSVGNAPQSPDSRLQAPEEERSPPTPRKRGERASARESRATRLPDHFELTPSRRDFAVAQRLDAERTFAKFVTYWRGRSGAAGRKVDWDATWQNWCLNEVDRNPAGGRRWVTKNELARAAIEAWEGPSEAVLAFEDHPRSIASIVDAITMSDVSRDDPRVIEHKP